MSADQTAQDVELPEKGTYLVSARICPFVQRTAIVLEEKKLSYDVRFVDLHDKPDWFLSLSPLGKVPVLKMDGLVLFESAVINEYLNERYENPPMLSPDPERRARERASIEFFGQLTGDSYRMMVGTSEDVVMAAAEKARQKLQWIQANWGILIWGGTDGLNLVEAAAAPVFQRLQWMETIYPKLRLFEGCEDVLKWRERILSTESVKASIDNKTHSYFLAYLKGRGSPSRHTAISFLGSHLA
jgi:glutathione S-transferase